MRKSAEAYVLGTFLSLTGIIGTCQQAPNASKGMPGSLALTLQALKQVNQPDDFALPEAAAGLLVSLRDQAAPTGGEG